MQVACRDAGNGKDRASRREAGQTLNKKHTKCASDPKRHPVKTSALTSFLPWAPERMALVRRALPEEEPLPEEELRGLEQAQRWEAAMSAR